MMGSLIGEIASIALGLSGLKKPDRCQKCWRKRDDIEPVPEITMTGLVRTKWLCKECRRLERLSGPLS